MRAYFKKNIPTDKAFRGQGQLIMSKLNFGEADAKTTVQLANEIKDELVTRQTAERVVAFYVSVWLKKGYVAFVEIATDENAKPAAEGQSKTTADPHPPTGEWRAPEPAVEKTMPSLVGKKLGEAILAVLEFKAKGLSEQELVEVLNANGYEVHINQVRTGIQNLTRKEAVMRNGDKIAVAA